MEPRADREDPEGLRVTARAQYIGAPPSRLRHSM